MSRRTSGSIGAAALRPSQMSPKSRLKSGIRSTVDPILAYKHGNSRRAVNPKAFEYVQARDFPGGATPTCLFCRKELDLANNGARSGNDKAVMDHLDDHPQNNDYDNLALCHQGCNQRKRAYPEYQLIAADKAAENAKQVPTSEMLGVLRGKRAREGHRLQTLIKEWLEEHVSGSETVLLRSACDIIGSLADNELGWGHPKTIERRIEMLASPPAPWQITGKGRQQIVSRRTPAGAPAGGRSGTAPSSPSGTARAGGRAERATGGRPRQAGGRRLGM